MATKKYKPTTPGFRSRSVVSVSTATRTTEKRLRTSLGTKAGRNNQGHLTVRGRGGGVKRHYRFIDFNRNKFDVPGEIVSIEYDPYRTALISLVNYKDGDKRYIITPNKAELGQIVESGENVDIKIGNTLPLRLIPDSTFIHNVELHPGKGGQLARSAGSYAILQAKNPKYATVKLPSGEVRLININCLATIGEASNSEKRNTTVGKAGVNRHKGRRPKVRGAAMNPCDHPHGGGEGKAPVGMSGPKTAQGKPALGFKTRNRKKLSSKYIVKRKSGR